VSVHIMGLVWKYSRQTGTPLLMLLAVADYADDDGWAFPSVNELARKARLGGKQGRRILHGLLESGELEIHMGEGRRGTAGGTQKTHLYRVVVPDLKVLPQETPPLPRVLPSGVKGTPLQGQGTPIAMGVEPSLEPSVSRTWPYKQRRSLSLKMPATWPGTRPRSTGGPRCRSSCGPSRR